MVDFRARVNSEFEAIENTLSKLPDLPLSKLSELELAGVATLIHNFYNGIENILKQTFRKKSLDIPSGESWHRDLLVTARDEGIITSKLFNHLTEYLAFRHFFTHAYALDLQPDRMESLIENIQVVYDKFKKEILRTDF
ncbi:MAG: hypothetical protein L6425_05070 [Candidatus Aminicenantes bacterium]|nr:hypothetical protein [Candidatus Aminicenantes bacterium]